MVIADLGRGVNSNVLNGGSFLLEKVIGVEDRRVEKQAELTMDSMLLI